MHCPPWFWSLLTESDAPFSSYARIYILVEGEWRECGCEIGKLGYALSCVPAVATIITSAMTDTVNSVYTTLLYVFMQRQPKVESRENRMPPTRQ